MTMRPPNAMAIATRRTSSQAPTIKPFEAGGFYSPLPDISEVRAEAARIWPAQSREVPGVDMNAENHLRFLTELFPPLLSDWDFPGEGSDAEGRFYSGNGRFDHFDSRALYCLLRHFEPQRVIEVGSGMSSLLSIETNERWLGGACDITLIEPYLPEYLRPHAHRVRELIEDKVQHVPLTVFEALEANDILFIDSSHVSKIGSDVNFLLFEVLPALKRGVIIHVHDIFLPRDYPQDWVLEQGRAWNEQYVLRAMLTYSSGFEVLFGSVFARINYGEHIERLVGSQMGGGSIWLRKTAGPWTPRLP